ncbi:MAG: cob(I)yrinic acid a,c-diamide adenosyltransferase [Desulfobacterales bacterium SG8_35_2]|jgi:cob(I)alamin adenosyltransferase|nr:MAG: cob(I)yrinic acid a,c-diamide adenosyltransferase [Desulfobacterales bacterium SG8_35_2]
MAQKGLILLYTGNGKGKTTAALGQVLRAAGHGFKVAIIQFIKNLENTGEIKAAKKIFADHLEIYPMGSGFTWDAKDRAELQQAAEKGWKLAREKIESGNYCMVILDELTYALNYGLLDQDEVITFLQQKPEKLHIIITGRDASDKLIALADLVTEMREIKHPYQKGIKAMKGIEF